MKLSGKFLPADQSAPGKWPPQAFLWGLGVFGLSLAGLILLFYTFPDHYDSYFYELDPQGMHQFQAHWNLRRLPQFQYRPWSRDFRLLLVLLWASYTLMLLACLRGARPAGRLPLAAVLLAATATALFAPPLLSTDVYANVSHGRIFVLYGHSPYLWHPSGLVALHDPIARFLVWDWPTVYGPVWTWMEIGVAALLRDAGVWTQVIALKLILAGAMVASAVAGRRLAARLSPGRETVTFLAVGLNPLFLLEGPGNGHNDLVCLAFLLFGAALYIEKKYVAALLCLGLSVGIKPITLALLPWALLDYSRGLPWRQTLKAALTSTALVLLPLALSFVGLWAGPATLSAMHQRAAYGQTHALLVRGILLFLYLGLSLWLWKRRTEGGWLTAWAVFSAALMFLFLIPAFPWYMIWFWPICLLRWNRRHLSLSVACLAFSLFWMTDYGMLAWSKPGPQEWINMDGTKSALKQAERVPELRAGNMTLRQARE